MAKKAAPKAPARKAPTADHHRAKAAEFRAKARLHEAQAEMADVKNPPKNRKPGTPYPY